MRARRNTPNPHKLPLTLREMPSPYGHAPTDLRWTRARLYTPRGRGGVTPSVSATPTMLPRPHWLLPRMAPGSLYGSRLTACPPDRRSGRIAWSDGDLTVGRSLN